LLVFLAPLLALLVFSDPAWAVTHGGEGLYGPTNDVTITNAMFFLLALFPAIIIVLTILQGFADRRKHRKWEQEKLARAAEPSTGGW
jgi:preprotein translocase subunit SecG